jgi:hypothetical protein
MNIIKTKYFQNQVNNLLKNFPKLEDDLQLFEESVSLEPFSSLWNNVYKFRLKNSSIPTWKRSGFRLIVLILKDTFIPLIIYSKNFKENVSDKEIIQAKEKVLEEL